MAIRGAVTAVALLCAGCAGAGESGGAGPAGYALVNGAWFDGEGFREGTRYVVDGVFSERPARVDSVVDLEGAYVVPPFGDAHTHNLDGAFGIDRIVDAYQREGTFYVQVLTNSATGAAAVRGRFGRPGALSVAYAHGGLTSTLGHPFLAYEPRAMGLYDPAAWEGAMDSIRASRLREDDAYWFIDSARELDAKWPRIVAGGPDVLKVFVIESERHAELRDDSAAVGRKGLDPALLPAIVERARGAGLRVWAHVSTAHDFDVAVRAGVAGVAHLPGADLAYEVEPGADLSRYEISDETAREAAARGVVVTPTASRAAGLARGDSARLATAVALNRRNLARLREHGVRIAVGADWYGEPAYREVAALRALGLWTDAELLEMWSVTTPRAIFPHRRIGAFRPGFEASLVALPCDPLVRFECLRDVRLRISRGVGVGPLSEEG